MRERNSGITAASFGVAAGVFALFFFSDVPKVRDDIMLVCFFSPLLSFFLPYPNLCAKREKEEEERRILLANSCGAGWDLENSICGGTFPERGAGE